MLIDDFDFELPEELVAKYPLNKRDNSRLLYYKREVQEAPNPQGTISQELNKNVEHKSFKDICSILKAGDILVRNVTRVLAARFFVIDKEKPENKAIEILLVKENAEIGVCDQRQDGTAHKRASSRLRRTNDRSVLLVHEDHEDDENAEIGVCEQSPDKKYRWTALAKPGKKIKTNPRSYIISGSSEEIMIFKENAGNGIMPRSSSEDGMMIVEFKSYEQFLNIITNHGTMPIPPYLQRSAEDSDKERYQTVYSKQDSLGSSIAAPTAGLHFTEEIIKELTNKGVEFIDLNLDVGIGTFKPVSVSEVKDHKMHFETYEIISENWDKIQSAKAEGRRIIAIGTTSLRCLESIAITGKLRGETDLYIYPGDFKFKIIDGLLTNFHLPKSTLLLLVSTLIGIEECKALYRIAVEEKYRFFSYGDCCLLL
ncbi:MAG: tRNA preQ1(34) S-adenosylmethionine ribosyltransferase-isomerase QueA [Candidatus Melainabacteria bacterium]|nr:tRNA preQ1(34) S-adenosylmethionine ribosyltransferase-isomerase QueA [Candidatus Melainabacteria bacterium]